MGDVTHGMRAGAGLSLAREVAQWLRQRAEAHVHAAELVEVLWPRFVAAGAVAADRDTLCEVAVHLSAWCSYPSETAEVPRELGEVLRRFSSAALRELVKWLNEPGDNAPAPTC
jgi:hypothetical protein